MKTSEVLNILTRMLNGGDDLREHAETLGGPRRRGSTTKAGLSAIPAEREGVPFEPPVGICIPGCRYLRFDAPELRGRMGAVPLSEAESLGLEVQQRDGAHGPELFAAGAASSLGRIQ